MPRIRTIKPEFWSDTRMVRLPALPRLVFLCLWSMADDEGRIEGDAESVWRFGSFREDSREVARALSTLRELGRIVLYEVAGNPYIQIVNWAKHQKVDKPSTSKLPAPSESCDLLGEPSPKAREDSSNAREASGTDQGSGIRDQGSGSGTRDSASPPPKKPAARPPDPVRDEVWGTGLRVLVGKGLSEPMAREFLGKLARDYGQLLVLEAVRDCERLQPAEPRGWLAARCQERRAQAGSKQAALEARNAEVARRWAAKGEQSDAAA